MPSMYLRPEDYAPYGVPAATTAQVAAASSLIDGYLRRPEGMLWSPDYAGLPCYMSAMNPRFTFTATTKIVPGLNLPVTLNKPVNMTDLIGETVVLDRANPDLVEFSVINSIAPGGLITLSNVDLTHQIGCTVDFGMCIYEERSLAARRSIARVSKSPIERLLSGLGRYAYGRRLDQKMGQFNEVNLLAAVQAFGGPPMWVPFDVNQASISAPTNEIWVPAGLMLAYYSDVRLRYVAGFSINSMPDILRSACALAISAQLAAPELAGNIKMAKAGDTAIQRFTDSIMDSDLKGELDSFRARLVI